MIKIRPSQERGHFDHGWLETWHTFSFASYLDPEQMGFGRLRVINHDIVQPGKGFGTHPHREMEIITYLLRGSLTHRDSMGNELSLGPGEVQVMSAGTGLTHSEFNASDREELELLQIWIEPAVRGVAPRHDERRFPPEELQGALRQIVSPDGADGSLAIGQDARIYAARLSEGDQVELGLKSGRPAWVQVARGTVALNGSVLKTGDGAGITNEESLGLRARQDSEIMVFDLPAQ